MSANIGNCAKWTICFCLLLISPYYTGWMRDALLTIINSPTLTGWKRDVLLTSDQALRFTDLHFTIRSTR